MTQTEYELTEFTPAGAAALAGVGVTLQRDWRRRGFLPPNKGHARFDVFTVSELLALQLLGQRGIGPQQAQAVFKECARGIAWHALGCSNAYHGPAAHGVEPDMTWREVVNIHRIKMMGQDGTMTQPRRFIVWWADDSHSFTDDLNNAFGNTSTTDPRVSGVVQVLDLEAAGIGLLASAGAPLVYVTMKQGN